MARIHIKANRKQIVNGKPVNCFLCPIALAAKKAGLKGVSVETDTLSFVGPQGKRLFIDLSNKAQAFISRFDGGKKVNPIKFCVRLKKATVKALKPKRWFTGV